MPYDNLNKVTILGCGWLGTALAKSLNLKGYQVLGTRQSEQGVAELKAQGINAYQLSLSATSGKLESLEVFNCETLILSFPPKLKQGQKDYPDKIKNAVNAAEKSGVKRLILVSTTGIYNGLSGKVAEDTGLDLSAEKVETLNQAEQAVLALSRQKSFSFSNNSRKYFFSQFKISYNDNRYI